MIGLLVWAALVAATAVDTPRIEPLNSRADILFGSGCNVIVVKSKAGLLLVDDQRPSDFYETSTLLEKRFSLPVIQVVNTHFHLDHSGGNGQFQRDGAIVTAQQNVYTRLADPKLTERYRLRYPNGGSTLAPARIYTKHMTIRFGTEQVELIHVANAHTDGDTLVKLRNANVIHLGDVFFNGLYPHIDTESGGTIQGNIHAVDVALRLTNGQTLIVPGHGPVASRDELKAYRAMLADTENAVKTQMAAGRSLEDIVASNPAARYHKDGDAAAFVTAIYKGLKPKS